MFLLTVLQFKCINKSSSSKYTGKVVRDSKRWKILVFLHWKCCTTLQVFLSSLNAYIEQLLKVLVGALFLINSRKDQLMQSRLHVIAAVCKIQLSYCNTTVKGIICNFNQILKCFGEACIRQHKSIKMHSEFQQFHQATLIEWR